MKKLKYLFFILCGISFSLFLNAQEKDTVLVDFGNNLSPAPWNNLAAPADGTLENLMNTAGFNTGFTIAVTDSFNNINTAGTQEPDPSLRFPPTATGDSFFGNVSVFGGQVQPTGGVTISNLIADKVYSLEIFASRTASDNREAMYIVEGAGLDTILLDAASNTGMIASSTMTPSAEGKITITAGPGPNNTNGSGFYYLGLIRISYDHIASQVPMDTVFVDFGDNLSLPPINNMADPRTGLISDLTNSKGNFTGFEMSVVDSFNNINRAGTTTPDPSLHLPSTATDDSFFGSVTAFGGLTEPSGGVLISGLDPQVEYNFFIFASRTASDNREAKYLVQGMNTDSVFLNASSNSDMLAEISMIPTDEGNILITASPGANNDNGSKFYYFGALYFTYPELEEPTEVSVDVDSILIDFGSVISLDPWINITDPHVGFADNLTTKYGKETSYSIMVTDSFNNINTGGTNSPADKLGIPPTATSDSFFGNVSEFGGQVQSSGGVTLANLNTDFIYTISLFASREANDNREAKYVIAGASIDSVLLNASSNIDSVATLEMKPNQDGRIVITASPGPNNDNGSQFYYLGAMIISFSDADNDTLLVDFGDIISPFPWNNIEDPNKGEINDLINSKKFNSGYGIRIVDDFNNINRAGTANPDPSIGIPATASGDSFFGNVAVFGGEEQPSGGFELYNLNPEKEYTLSIFASRTASDNREAQYIVSGLVTDTLYLDAASNTDSVVMATMLPDENGVINVLATPGPNNTNSSNFYYLGALKVIYESDEIGDAEVTLIQPNGGEFWQVGKIVDIDWSSRNVLDVVLEYSIDAGDNWTVIDTVSSFSGNYSWTVPSTPTSEALVRISGDEAIDVSDGVFEISEDNATCRIVVLGSSTAAGTGAFPSDSSWVNRYGAFLADNSAFEVINLARGGYTTYHILPTGTVSEGVNIVIDEERNITKALSLDPFAIIINMPSNDAASNFSSEAQMINYNLLYTMATEMGVDAYIATTQPRNFENQDQINNQIDTRDSILSTFGENAIDFWSGIADDNGFILPEYDSGDGVHLNNAGHYLLFTRVMAKNLELNGCVSTSTDEPQIEYSQFLNAYPNPNNGQFRIEITEQGYSPEAIEIYDTAGKMLLRNVNLPNSSFIEIEINHKGLIFCTIQLKGTDGKIFTAVLPVIINQ